ncbi:MAG: OB-fold domain-containing protein [Myxococcota bacterium]|nr:OB-fold domain-containing protein [Myxococcota bacterium]
MADETLWPPINEENAPFWEGTRQGELRMQRCPDTQRFIFPPRLTSPWSNGAIPEWHGVSGRGRIWSFVVPHPPLLPPFDAWAPYNVILVSLDEDPAIRLVGNLIANEGAQVDSIDPSQIELDAPVRVVFERLSDEIYLPRWVLD